jgi:hypothetical protein
VSGCDPADFNGIPAGAVALVQRGTCPFTLKYTTLQAGAGRRADLEGRVPGSGGSAPDHGIVMNVIADSPGWVIGADAVERWAATSSKEDVSPPRRSLERPTAA